MKICVAQTKPIKGNIQSNIEQHKKFINTAISKSADTIIFPELSLTGYEPTLAKELATNQGDSRLDVFQMISNSNQITIGIGLPTKHDSGICISMILFQPQIPRKTYSKRYLHADEKPFFVTGQNFPSVKMSEMNVALAICYELTIPVHVETAVSHQAQIYIASVAKTAAGVNNAHKRLAHIAKAYSIPVLMANCVGPSDNFISAGGTAVWHKTGQLAAQLDNENEGLLIYDTDTAENISILI